MGARSEPVPPACQGCGQTEPVHLDHLLADLASAQHGVVARRQLLTRGFSRRAIEHRLSRGRLHRLHRGVYAVGHPGLSREGRWLAAVLACGPGAVLSHQSAAALWDLRATSRATIDVTVGARHRRPGIDLHLSRCLKPQHRTEHRGVPCTTPARTLVDLAAVLDTAGIERAWHRAEMLDVLDVRAVEHALDNGRGHRGATTVRALLAEQGPDHVTRSELEERFLALCESAGLPRPHVNTLVEANGATYEVDFLWREQGLVVETDGWTPHRTREAFETDRRRDADLLVAGFSVARVTWRQMTRDPDRVGSMLASLLA